MSLILGSFTSKSYCNCKDKISNLYASQIQNQNLANAACESILYNPCGNPCLFVKTSK